jgi:CRP/FNR family transcriptional regulator, cyclic AMP receptor protein
VDPKRLASIPLLAGLTDDERAILSAYAVEQELAAGDVLIREGEYAYDIVLIEAGEAEVLQGDTRIAHVGAGDVIGEVGVLNDVLRTATVVATGPMRVIVMSSWEVKRLLADPAVRQRLEAQAAARQSSS